MSTVSGCRVFVFGRRLRAHVMALPLSSLSLHRVTFHTRVAQSGRIMLRNTRFPLPKGVKPLFQKQILAKRRPRRQINAQNESENLPIRWMFSVLFRFLMWLDTVDLFGCGFVLDITKTWQAQWLSMPVSHCGDTDQQYLSTAMFLEHDWCVFYSHQWLIHAVGSGNQICVDKMFSSS